MQWGVCTTVKAPLDQILAFVAWHLHLGATRIWVHLDDPDPATMHVLSEINGVVPVACDATYWASTARKRRPPKQEGRQSTNIQRVYDLAELPVIAHLDVDEFLWPARPVAQIIEDDTELPFLRAEPAEALHDADLLPDIFTATRFHKPFAKNLDATKRAEILGTYAPLLPYGILSHRVGKSLFRTGNEMLEPRLHAGRVKGDTRPLHMPFHPDLTVLHFHAQDRAAWEQAVPVRATTGAYRFNKPLAAFLTSAASTEIAAFYEATQVASPALCSAYAAEGLLVEAELKLKDKVAPLF